MVNLDALRDALNPIAEIGVVEETFDMKGTPITMRPLKPLQETEVQRWAGQVMTDSENEDQATGVEYLDRFKIGCLSYAIVSVGELDLRQSDVIETGKTLPNGTAVKVPKHKGMREILMTWTRPVIDSCFRKFGEMMERAEIEVEKSVKFDPVDLDTEITRLKDRLNRMELLKERRTVGDVKVPVQEAMVDALVDKPEPEPEPEPEAPRRSVIPNANRTQAVIEINEASEQVNKPAETQPALTPENTVVSATGSVAPAAPNEGWIDQSDMDVQDVIAAENARLAKMRQQRNKPPHAAAAAASTAAISDEVPVFDPAAHAKKASQDGEVAADDEANDDEINPKFKPPGR